VKFLILTLVATMSLTISAAETTETSTEQLKIAELVALNKAWFDARVNQDWDTLERILDDKFLVTFATGETMDRSAFIRAVDHAEFPQFEVLHDDIRIHGNTALLINFSEDRGSKVSWVAVKKDGQWRIISMTFTVISMY